MTDKKQDIEKYERGATLRGKQDYDPSSIEKKWQEAWEKEGLYQAEDPPAGGPKYYILIEFPYPSGAGLHVGHVRSWSAMDAYSRQKRMQGFNVLYPIGWDAFGLPAENYALKMGVHPSRVVPQNIASFKTQCKSLGLSFDWSREINTTDADYYKWTQWIFLKFFEKDLAYQADVAVNWCSSCKINLADEEVLSNGTHERCGNLTEKKMQKQWLLKITAYADRLIEDLKLVDYSTKIRVQQENWIGRSEGATISFSVILSDPSFVISTRQLAERNPQGFILKGISRRPSMQPPRDDRRGLPQDDMNIVVYTVFPETIFGVTYMVLSPDHPLVSKLTSDEQRESVNKYIKEAQKKSEIERTAIEKEKTGVFTGSYCINPVNGQKVPIWIADYVIATYGTGAVMGVPGSDHRDFAFAQKYSLPIIRVIGKTKDDTSPVKTQEDVLEEGILVNSEEFSGLSTPEPARDKIKDYLEEKRFGKRTVQFHLRDWVFSRQHYWGEPIPIIYCRKCWEVQSSKFKVQSVEGRDFRIIDGKEYVIVPVPEDQLPVELPFVEKYEPSGTGESPLANVTEWVNTTCPKCGGAARRETDTMPNWAGSNWYFLAYLFTGKLGVQSSKFPLRPQSEASKVQSSDKPKGNGIFEESQDVIKYWMPVDLYQGGFEHTTLHLLYSRFVYKFLYDIGAVPTSEPYAKRRSHGIVLGTDGRKMSKSFGNVISPDDIVGKFGADTLRVYEMFMGPFDQAIAWSEEGVEGCFRFLKRVWQLSNTKISEDQTSPVLLSVLHRTIKKVGEDIETLKFNTAVASMMEFINAWQSDEKGLNKEDLGKFLLILAPFAPHLTEELFYRISADKDQRISADNLWQSIHSQPWPKYDPKFLEEEEATIVVQVNGKIRDTIQVQSSKYKVQSEIEQLARESDKVRKYLDGKTVDKVIYVEGKIINFVVK